VAKSAEELSRVQPPPK